MRLVGFHLRPASWCVLLLSAVCACPSSESAVAPRAGSDGGVADAATPATEPAGWDDELRIPELADTNPAADVVEVNLTARPARLAVAPGADMWTYEGRVPGPTIHTKRGDTLVVHFKNELPEPTTIHWHGVRVPNAMDGVPAVQTPVPPGGTFEYRFVTPDAGTFWYHPHVDSSAQVGFGLYGALLVDDPNDTLKADVLSLVLSDASVTDAGTLDPGDAQGHLGDYFGREGSVQLVNGREHARLLARPGLPQRWRVVNACRARYATLHIPSFRVTRLGGDESYAAAPEERPDGRTTLAPGERAELLVVPQGADGETVSVTWESYDRFHAQADLRSVPIVDVELRGDPVTSAASLPSPLGDVTAVDTSGAAPRTVTFDDVGGVLGINGQVGADIPMLHVAANTTEVWTIKNQTLQDHPFHIHGFRFQVVDTGSGNAASQLEWRDTINVVAKRSIKVAIPFDGRKGMWMYHCHILDHAEGGMMAMLMVE